MRWRIAVTLVGIFLAGLSNLRAWDPPPLKQAHAHNDYRHPRPLLDALSHDFSSVEADIHLVDGELLVAHDRKEVQPGRTLQKLYLDALRSRIKTNPGMVFSREFTLLIDFKTPWTNTYPVLRSVLTNYSDILTTYRGSNRQANAVTVILSGSRAKEMFAGEEVRFAAYDGELKDLNVNPPADLVPWISADWKKTFTWRGTNAMPEADLGKLQSIVRRTQGQGRRLRFWGAPDFPAVWQVLLTNNVDLINTDKLEGLEKFLRKTP